MRWSYNRAVSRTEEIHERLLSLAIEAIDAEGEGGVRVGHIAAAAGVTNPTLYRHFGSREGLVIEAQAQRYMRALRQFSEFSVDVATATNVDEFRAAVEREFNRVWGAERAAGRRVRLNVLGSAYARPELRETIARYQHEYFMQIAQLLEPFKAKGWIRADLDVATFAYWMTGVFFGRSLLEMCDGLCDEEAWNSMAAGAILQVAFGS